MKAGIFGDSLYELVKDRPLPQDEFSPAASYYGNARAFRDYSSYNASAPIRAAVHHIHHLNLSLPHTTFGDFRVQAPLHICSALNAAQQFGLRSGNLMVPVGPFIHYAETLLSKEEIATKKAELGKTLLIFPPHSIDYIDAHTDIQKTCERIRELYHCFQSFIVSVYWKDVQRGWADAFSKEGFIVESAGHIYHPDFMRRLRTLIEISDAVYSSSESTSIGFSIYLKKPVFFEHDKDQTFHLSKESARADPLAVQELARLNHDTKLKDETVFHRQLLVISSTDITEEKFPSNDQEGIAEFLWEINRFRTPDELNDILRLAEELANNGLGTSGIARTIELITNKLDKKDDKDLLFLCKLLSESCPHSLRIACLQLKVLLFLGKVDDAVALFSALFLFNQLKASRLSEEHSTLELLLRDNSKNILTILETLSNAGREFAFSRFILLHFTSTDSQEFIPTVLPEPNSLFKDSFAYAVYNEFKNRNFFALHELYKKNKDFEFDSRAEFARILDKVTFSKDYEAIILRYFLFPLQEIR
jgi:hypothetical protein